MGKKPDLETFSALQQGSETAFKKVYQDNRTLFLNFAGKYGLNREDILDIYQDAYIAFYENICNGKLVTLKSSLSTYLIGIGKYMILERLRKNKQTLRNEALLRVRGSVDEEVASFEPGDEKLSPEEVLLQKYFNQLSETCQTILTLFYYKKYSIKQIMEAGNYNSENVVKSQKSRCLKTLKESFKSRPHYT